MSGQRAGRGVFRFSVLCYLLLSAGYLVSTPAFEAPDEGDHYRYAFHLAQTRALPLMQGTAARLGRPTSDELVQGYHPPLYYVLLAAGLLATGHGDTAAARRLNPEFGDWIGRPASMNLRYLHGFDERAPVSREMRLLWGLRALSLLFGLLTLLACHRLGRLAFPGLPAAADVAVLLLACLPHWTYLHGALNNDIPAADLSHLVLWIVAAALARGRLRARDALAAGALAGLAILCKLTALFLLPLLATVAALACWRWRPQRGETLRAALLGALAVLLVPCGYFLRNLRLYGGVLALDVHRSSFEAIAVPEGRAVEWIFEHALPGFFRSLLGQFGWKILPPLPWLVSASQVVVLASLAGWLLLAVRRRRARAPLAHGAVVALLLGAALLVFALTLHYNLALMGDYGRYLFPVVGPLAILLGAGLAALLRGLPRAVLRVLGPLLLAAPPAAALVVLCTSFRPAFDVTLAPAPSHHASLVAALATPPALPAFALREPEDGARRSLPPVLRWEPAPPRDGGPPLYSVHVYTGTGRLLLASYELSQVEIRETSWELPAEAWALFPPDEAVFWKVRAVPDRSRGESVLQAPASPPRRIMRIVAP